VKQKTEPRRLLGPRRLPILRVATPDPVPLPAQRMKGEAHVGPVALAVEDQCPITLKPEKELGRVGQPGGGEGAILDHVQHAQQQQRLVGCAAALGGGGGVEVAEAVEPAGGRVDVFVPVHWSSPRFLLRFGWRRLLGGGLVSHTMPILMDSQKGHSYHRDTEVTEKNIFRINGLPLCSLWLCGKF
jgi:hypothetical protein